MKLFDKFVLVSIIPIVLYPSRVGFSSYDSVFIKSSTIWNSTREKDFDL